MNIHCIQQYIHEVPKWPFTSATNVWSVRQAGEPSKPPLAERLSYAGARAAGSKLLYVCEDFALSDLG